MEGREVVFGRLFLGGIHHWAIKVGDTWYEINPNVKDTFKSIMGRRDSEDKHIPNTIVESQGEAAASSTEPERTVGHTEKSAEEISEFNESWYEEHSTYHLWSTNCQRYSYDLVVWLCGEEIADTLPMQEADQIKEAMKDAGEDLEEYAEKIGAADKLEALKEDAHRLKEKFKFW